MSPLNNCPINHRLHKQVCMVDSVTSFGGKGVLLCSKSRLLMKITIGVGATLSSLTSLCCNVYLRS